MSLSFFPKAPKFFELFAKQNFLLVKAVNILNNIFQNLTEVEDQCQDIYDIEEEGDALNREISNELASTFITPIDREDINSINQVQEDILDAIKTIAIRVSLCNFKKVRPLSIKLIDYLKEMILETEEMVQRLSKKEGVKENISRMDSLKDEYESLLQAALSELYETCQDSLEGIVNLVKWTRIYDQIEKAMKKTEDLSDVIEGVVLKNA